MVRLTVDLIDDAAQFQNPLKDREIDLRDNRIQQIENLGATRDLFEAIDLSNNDLKTLDGFPKLTTLRMLLVNNNRVSTFADNIGEVLPNLEDLILTNNNLATLGEVAKLAQCTKLIRLSLLQNPVSTTADYRLFLIHKIPTLRVIDFQRVKLKERKTAFLKFGGVEGESVLKEMAKTFVPGGEVMSGDATAMETDDAPKTTAYSEAQTVAIKTAIEKARNLEEVQKIERDLMRGIIPGVGA